MATISAMAGQMGTMYSMIQKSGGSLFGGGSATRLPSYGYGSAQGSNLNDSAYSVLGSRAELSGLLKEYDSTKKQFNTRFSSAMGDLKTATQGLQKANFDVAPQGASDEAVEANVKSATDSVRKFLDKYNDASAFLTSNREVSARVGNLANAFGDAKYFARSLETVGVKQDTKTGKLTLDEEKLAAAMKERPQSAKYVLGGLADRTADTVASAQLQKDRLFPTAAAMMGTSESGVKAMYSASATASQFRYAAVGNLISMMI